MVLHSLLDLLLKKLNCEDERVSISGYEAKQIEEILQTTSISPIIFQEENFDVVLEKFENIDEMEKQLNETEAKLSEHLIGIRRFLKRFETLEPFRFDDDDYYELCEDLCSTLDPDVKIACETLARSMFLKSILMRMCHPILKAYHAIEKKLCVLEVEVCALMKRLDKIFDSFQLVTVVQSEYEWCRVELDRVHGTFLKALNEIQDILDAKVNKCQMLQLKEYVTERLNDIWVKLNKLRIEGRCQRASAVVIDKQTPVSTEAARKTVKTPCVCDGVHLQLAKEQKLLERMRRIDNKCVEILLETQWRKSNVGPPIKLSQSQ
ncbi:uncharacterized protein LOC126763732 [Bactrocera neohumeralis]|uniref:uncharacterized protein LOC126763732 n=1 Tax=Bactrocera neohumeralis TaxID=98809 RepID=UPI00216631BE|nr:uncharacterized protein LOC126763732 [Bactrocera neohumeralis]